MITALQKLLNWLYADRSLEPTAEQDVGSDKSTGRSPPPDDIPADLLPAIIQQLPCCSWRTARSLCKRWKAACDARQLSVKIAADGVFPGQLLQAITETARSSCCICAVSLDIISTSRCISLDSLRHLSSMRCLTTLRLTKLTLSHFEVNCLCTSLARLPTLRSLIVDHFCADHSSPDTARPYFYESSQGLQTGLSPLTRLTQLHSLDVEIIDQKDIKSICSMPRLRSLVLRIHPVPTLEASLHVRPEEPDAFLYVERLTSLTSLQVLTAREHPPPMRLAQTADGCYGVLDYDSNHGQRGVAGTSLSYCSSQDNLDPHLGHAMNLASLNAISNIPLLRELRVELTISFTDCPISLPASVFATEGVSATVVTGDVPCHAFVGGFHRLTSLDITASNFEEAHCHDTLANLLPSLQLVSSRGCRLFLQLDMLGAGTRSHGPGWLTPNASLTLWGLFGSAAELSVRCKHGALPPHGIWGCSKLQHLHLDGAVVSKEQLLCLDGLQNLSLTNCTLQAVALSSFTQLPLLQALVLDVRCGMDAVLGVEAVCVGLPQLRSLKLRLPAGSAVSESEIAQLCHKPGLQQLELGRGASTQRFLLAGACS